MRYSALGLSTALDQTTYNNESSATDAKDNYVFIISSTDRERTSAAKTDARGDQGESNREPPSSPRPRPKLSQQISRKSGPPHGGQVKRPLLRSRHRPAVLTEIHLFAKVFGQLPHASTKSHVPHKQRGLSPCDCQSQSRNLTL